MNLIIILLLGLIVTPLLIPSQVRERILFTFTQKAESGQMEVAGFKLDTSTTARVRSWKRAIRDLPQHPILGFGITGYKFMDAQYPRVLVETGLLGFLAFTYLIYSVFQMAKENLGRIEILGNRGLVIGFIAGLVVLLFHSIGANTFIILRIMEPFWLLAGIVAVLPALELSDRPSFDNHDKA